MSDNQAPIDWDAPAPNLTYIDPDQAREERRRRQAEALQEIRAIMVSGHNLHLEILAASIEFDADTPTHISLSAVWHGQVQRPGLIARPNEGGQVVKIKLPATIEREQEPGSPEQEPETETTADRIQQRSDLR